MISPAPAPDQTTETWEAIIIGGGFAGLSAATYLGRALRRTLVLDEGKSLALWEPNVQNYLGFPNGVSGEELLRLGRLQAQQYSTVFKQDRIHNANKEGELFRLEGQQQAYHGKRVLIATGLYHLPPDIPGVNECLGFSLFFCKDCDAYRVQNKRVAIIGNNNEAVEYALGMLVYSSCILVTTNGKTPAWDPQHAAWMEEYHIPVYTESITEVRHQQGQISALTFASGLCMAIDCAFTTRGDIYHNQLAKALGAKTDAEGQILVDEDCRTCSPGVYAAGCVTQANCQMIIAAGQGATAAQAINRDLFEESLRTHSLRRIRASQLRQEKTAPEILRNSLET